MRPAEFTRRGWLGLAAAAYCSQRDAKSFAVSQAPNSSGLPTRPNANQAFPGMVARWNAMYADRTARNLIGQLQLHALMCFPGKDCKTGRPIGNVHYSPDFVLWHRAFLYYHEQILNAFGSASGGSSMGLPYWDWSTRSPCPPAYLANASTFRFSGNLYRSPQMLGSELSSSNIAGTIAYLRTLHPNDAAKELFYENIHKVPHSCLGWNRRPTDLQYAAGDPLFYGHHANLDRLANHIFQPTGGIGWPTPSGITYCFIDANGQQVPTTLDAFASMSSPYEGDQPIDTSRYRVAAFDDVPVVNEEGYSQVRMKLRFSDRLPMGRYRLVSGKGAPLAGIASIEHHGATDFVVWLTVANYRKARAEGVMTAKGRVIAKIAPGATLVTKVQ